MGFAAPPMTWGRTSIAHHSPRRGPIDLMALRESLCDDASESRGRVRPRGGVDGPYLGRPLALKRCIGNLFDNALRCGGEADVEAKDGETAMTVTIADPDPGIPPDPIDRVFVPFFRLEESRGRDSGGTGLGLGIARNNARTHGGDRTPARRCPPGLYFRR